MKDFINTTLGSCQLISLLNKGGMGEIYLAKQPLLNRTVAVKVIRTDRGQSASIVQRFEQEAHALATLEHPHIVPLYEYGQQEDIAYFVMPYIAGGTLRERLKRGILPIGDAIQLLEQLASALDFAHQRSIIHRDIKPANVLLRDGSWPLLADFGIAKLQAEIAIPSETQTRGHIGTPSYMAPEQWYGSSVSRQTDMYALGVMLYELLAGTPPFIGQEWGSIMRQHLQESPPSLCTRNPTVPSTLEQVVFRAMAKEPMHRFGTMLEFALAARQAIGAKNSPPVQSVQGQPASMSGPLQSPIFQGIPSSWRPDPFVVPPAFDPRFTFTGPTVPDHKVKQTNPTPTPTPAPADFLEASETELRASAYPTVKVNPQAISPSSRWLTTPLLLAEWRDHPGSIDTVACLPDGKRVISSGQNSIFLWETGIPHPIAQLQGHARAIWALVITADGRLCASGSWDRHIRLWDIPQARMQRTLIGHTDIVLALALAMNERLLISTSRDGTLRLWELPGGRQVRSISHPGGPVWSVVTFPSEDLVAAGAENGSVGLWNLKNGRAVWQISLGNVGCVKQLLLLSKHHLLCIPQRGVPVLIEASTGALQTVSSQPAIAIDNALILNGQVLSADAYGMLSRWNVEQSQYFSAIQAHYRRIPAMATHPLHSLVATGSEERLLKLWRFLEIDRRPDQK